MRTTHFRAMKRDKQQGGRGRALAVALGRELRQQGHIVAESVAGEFCTSASFETVQDLAYHLADLTPGAYSTANLHIFETE